MVTEVVASEAVLKPPGAWVPDIPAWLTLNHVRRTAGHRRPFRTHIRIHPWRRSRTAKPSTLHLEEDGGRLSVTRSTNLCRPAPRSRFLCLPGDSTRPPACGPARPGTGRRSHPTWRFHSATTGRPYAPPKLSPSAFPTALVAPDSDAGRRTGSSSEKGGCHCPHTRCWPASGPDRATRRAPLARPVGREL